jgi:hypothetical protein
MRVMSHGHVQLAESVAMDSGSVARELVPAEQVADDEWVVSGTPGILNGCAAGDRIRVHGDGTFEILVRGGNIAAHMYALDPFPEASLLCLRQDFEPLGGMVEWPATRKFAVVTVPVTVGFPAIEGLVQSFTAQHDGAEWNFGNVYNDAGSPLNWWS